MDEGPGFWNTTTGLVTAIGGLIGAIAAIVTALAATGVLSGSGTANADPVGPPHTPSTTFVPATTAAPDLRPDPTTDPSGAGDGNYPPAVEANFTSSCLANGSTEDWCRCALDTFESELSLAEFITVEAELNSTGTISDPTISALFEAVQIRCQ